MKAKPSGRKPSRDELQTLVRGAGLRSTQARIAVLEHFHRQREPQTHAAIAQSLQHLGFNSTTVYRNLLELAEAGLLARVELGDHVWRFELSGLTRQPFHPHFLCLDCGAVACLGDGDAGARLAQFAKGARIGQVTEVLLKGHCNQCR